MLRFVVHVVNSRHVGGLELEQARQVAALVVTNDELGHVHQRAESDEAAESCHENLGLAVRSTFALVQLVASFVIVAGGNVEVGGRAMMMMARWRGGAVA